LSVKVSSWQGLLTKWYKVCYTYNILENKKPVSPLALCGRLEKGLGDDRMNARMAGLGIVAALVIGLIIGYSVFGGTRVTAQTVGATDLVVGTVYEVADFKTCQASNGTARYEFHFGGADRSRRAQQIPVLDGRGRRIMRINKSLPFGTLRLVKVVEHRQDPTLEGFVYGSFVEHWEGLVVEINGQVQPQRVVGPCGPAR